MTLISKRRLEAIKLDIETLEKTGASSLAISADLTKGMVELVINKLKVEHPQASDLEILSKTRNYLFHGNS